MTDRFLPAGVAPNQITARIGLISDTHMPERCRTLPPALPQVLDGVDLLLHAGDVGELWVLDKLSAIAPVIAVHGNDDTVDATRELPQQQLVAVGGTRILLWHSHHPDRAEEMAARRIDAWAPKLAYRAGCARRAGAGVAVFGHTHIPMAVEQGEVWLVNPGAIASGSPFTHQRVQTVALLFVQADGPPLVTHVDLARPGHPYTPNIDWAAGFAAALDAFSESILAPDLAPYAPAIQWEEYADLEAFKQVVLRLAHPCWAGEKDAITRAELLAAVDRDPDVHPADKAMIHNVLDDRKGAN